MKTKTAYLQIQKVFFIFKTHLVCTHINEYGLRYVQVWMNDTLHICTYICIKQYVHLYEYLCHTKLRSQVKIVLSRDFSFHFFFGLLLFSTFPHVHIHASTCMKEYPFVNTSQLPLQPLQPSPTCLSIYCMFIHIMNAFRNEGGCGLILLVYRFLKFHLCHEYVCTDTMWKKSTKL